MVYFGATTIMRALLLWIPTVLATHIRWLRGFVCGVLFVALATHSPVFAQTKNTIYLEDWQVDNIDNAIKLGCRTNADPGLLSPQTYSESEIGLYNTGYTPMSRAGLDKLVRTYSKLPLCKKASETIAPVSPEGGFYLGGSLGGGGAHDSITNENQITLFGVDARPNPTASSSNSGLYGTVNLGYDSVIPFGGMGSNLLIGAEVFMGTANNSSTIIGIPGTGGIAPPAVMANDSVTMKETWNGGVIVSAGPIIQIGNMPVAITLDAGFGFQRISLDVNCTTAGACGANGIPAQTLTTTQTQTGYLIGGTFVVPVASVLGPSMPANNSLARLFRTANIRVQYLHGDFGHATATIGSPGQIQLTMDQKVTTDTLTIGLDIPLSTPTH